MTQFPFTPYDPEPHKIIKSILGVKKIKARFVPFVHSPKCTERTEAILSARDEYERTWKNHCPDCDGRGEHPYTYDPSPAGVALSPGYMEGSDPCETCIEAGCCPRCGEQLFADVDEFNDWLENQRPCPFCGWEHGKNEGDYLPEIPECYCWERFERINRKDYPYYG